MLTKAKPYSDSTAHARYYLSAGLFRPKCEQDNAQTTEPHYRFDVDDDRASDNVGHLALGRERRKLPHGPTLLCQDAAVGFDELALRASPSAAWRV